MPVSKPLILEVPEECLPPLTDELRWKALRRHIKDYSPMYDPPPEGVVAFPPMAVPPSDCYNYAKGQYSKITPAFLFFRKALLILVGGQDILKSVVEKGQCTGADVRDQWHVVLDRTLQEAQNRVASEQERVLIQVLRDDLKQGRSREVRIGLISYSLRLAAFSSLSILMAWFMGVEPIRSILQSFLVQLGLAESTGADVDPLAHQQSRGGSSAYDGFAASGSDSSIGLGASAGRQGNAKFPSAHPWHEVPGGAS